MVLGLFNRVRNPFPVDAELHYDVMERVVMRKSPDFIIWVLLAAVMLPWLVVCARVSINGDVAWMIGAAGRILSGEMMTQHFFDANPPLSMLLYIPVLAISSVGVPVWYASDLYVLLVAAAGLFLLARLLRCSPGLQPSQFWLIVVGYIVAITFPARFEIAQRDHFLAIALLPFLLGQFAVTQKWNVPKWLLLAVFIFGTPFLLLKPHYGLLPAIILMHRMLRQRRAGIVFDPDVVCLVAGCLIYAAVLWFRFPDFLSQGLAGSAALYAQEIYQSGLAVRRRICVAGGLYPGLRADH